MTYNVSNIGTKAIGATVYATVTDADNDSSDITSNYNNKISIEEDEDGEAYILKATSDAEDSEQVYSMVEDDDELAAVSGVFENDVGYY